MAGFEVITEAEEQDRIRQALQAEGERLRRIPATIDLGWTGHASRSACRAGTSGSAM